MNFLNKITAEINRAFMCFEGEDGAPGGSSGESFSVPDAGEPAAPATDDAPIEEYLGSKEVNPGGLPLAPDFDITGLSKEDIDQLIIENPELVLSEDDALALAKERGEKAPADDQEGGSGAGDSTGGSDEDRASGDTVGATDDDVKKFYAKTALTADQFKALDPKAQERLMEIYADHTSVDTLRAEAQKKMEQSELRLTSLATDPVIAARLEELRTNRQFVARGLPEASDEMIAQLDSLLAASDMAGAKALINSHIAANASAAVSHERAVRDSHAARTKLANDLDSKYSDLAKADKRLSIQGVDSINKIDQNDPRWLSSETKAMFDYFTVTRRLSPSALANTPTNELYAMYSVHKGWNVERDSKIGETARKSLLEKIKASNAGAKTTDKRRSSSRSIPTGSQGGESGGFDRDQLVAELAEGNTANYDRFLDLASDSPEQMAIADSVWNKAQAVRRSRSGRQLS